MDELTQELIGLMNITDLWKQNQFHKKIEELGYFSADYLKKIRNGKRSFKDNPENRTALKLIIKTYEVLLWRHKQSVNNIKVEL